MEKEVKFNCFDGDGTKSKSRDRPCACAVKGCPKPACQGKRASFCFCQPTRERKKDKRKEYEKLMMEICMRGRDVGPSNQYHPLDKPERRQCPEELWTLDGREGTPAGTAPGRSAGRSHRHACRSPPPSTRGQNSFSALCQASLTGSCASHPSSALAVHHALPSSFSTITNAFKSPDLTVFVGTKEFKCQREILKESSLFFRNTLEQEKMVKLCPECVSAEGFGYIYNWMQFYRESEGDMVPGANLYQVLRACRHLQVSELEERVRRRLVEGGWTEEQAVALYTEAWRAGDHDTAGLVLPVLASSFSLFVLTPAFLQLSLHQVLPLLHAELNVSSELEVVSAGCRWVEADYEARKRHIPEVMDCVRFGLMSSEQLLALQAAAAGSRVLGHPHTLRLVEDGIVYNSLKDEFNYPKENPGEFWSKCCELGVTVSHERCRKGLVYRKEAICFRHDTTKQS